MKSELTTRLKQAVRWGGLLTVGIAYAVLSHRAAASLKPDLLGALVALAPLLGLAFMLAWRSQQRALMLSLWLAASVVIYAFRSWLVAQYNWVFLLQHAGTYALLCAASGYWSISSGAMASSSVLCAHDGSFAAGLLEAMAQVMLEQIAVLLVAYDTDYPEPLRSVRPLPDTFGVALVLAPRRSERSLAQWQLAPAAFLSDAPAQLLEDDALELLRSSVPAARCLPLLRSVAAQSQGDVLLDYLPGRQLAVQVTHCL